MRGGQGTIGSNKGTNAPVWIARGAEIYSAIRPIAKIRFVGIDKVIVNQAETVSHFQFITKGSAQGFSYGENGHKFWVADFEAGDIIGYSEILTNAPIGYEVIAQSDIEMMVLPAAMFMKMLKDDQNLGAYIAENLAYNLRYTQTRLVEMSTMSAAARIYAELLRFSKPIGNSPGQRIVRPHPVYSNFALRVHSTRETVSRTVSELEKSGIVKRSTGSIIILKPDTLKKRIR